MDDVLNIADIDDEQYEIENSEPTDDMMERIFVLDKDGFSISREIPDDMEDSTNA